MTNSNKMLKYYIGLTVLAFFATGLVVYTIMSGSDSKADKQTTEKIQKVATDLDDYINNNGKVPSSLAVAGIKDVPPTITYKKLSEGKYKICVTYKTAGSSFDGGWSALFTGALLAQSGAGNTGDNQEQSYLDYYSLVYAHKKGENCQTITPYGTSDYNYPGGSQSNVENDYGAPADTGTAKSTCAPSEADFTYSAKGTITAINAQNQTITLNQETTNKPAEIEFDEITRAYDKNCTEVKIGTLKVGDNVKFYGYAGSSLVDVLELQ